MANFALPHFGYLDPAALEEYYDIDIPFNDSKIQIDLNFENKTIIWFNSFSQYCITKLQLVRVGIYPDSTGQFAIFDYSLGQEMTNYLVVINTDENGNLDYMTMES